MKPSESIRSKWLACLPILIALSSPILLAGCSDAQIKEFAKKIASKESKTNDLFAPITPTNETKPSNQESQTSEPSQSTSQAQRLANIPSSGIDLSGYAQDIAYQIAETIPKNPSNQVIKKGSLCNQILFNDTINKLAETLGSQGISKNLSLEIGVTVMPSGTPNKMVWKELWKIQTTNGVLSYPIIFAEDGMGGAFIIALDPQ
jgi:flagellar biosynthesis GTPase FlhF